MYGHAASTLALCEICPAYAPEYAKTINDEGQKVCKKHAVETCTDFKEMK